MVLPRPDKYPGDQKGRCHTCGFLALRTQDSTSLFHEADQEFRQRGVSRHVRGFMPTGAVASERMRPCCSAGAIEFDRVFPVWKSLFSESKYDTDEEWMVSFLHRVWDRPCQEWVGWIPGVPPKERREMLDREWMIERDDRRDREMREREDDRDCETREREDRRDAAAARRHWVEIVLIGGIATAAIVVATIIGALIERGSI